MLANALKKLAPAWVKQAPDRYRRHSLKSRFPGLREGQINHLMYLRDHIDLRNARVLEIGGDPDAHIARALRQLGAASVVTTNIIDGFESLPSYPGVERVAMDVRNFEAPKQSYDLVIGIALLEHLHDIPTALGNIFRATRPGGKIYFHGGPLWNSPKGHHLWATGPSGHQYRFTGDNPVANWEHLCKDESAMHKELSDRGYSAGDVAAMVDWIYHSPDINRTSTTQITQCFEDSPFNLLARTEVSGKEPDGDIATTLLARHKHPLSEYAILSIAFLAEKPMNG